MTAFIIPKLLYICLYSLYGSAIAYLSIFYSQVLHLRSYQIGVILAIAPFVQVVACPFWTSVADRHPKWHGPLMGMLAIIGGSSVLALYFLPPIEWVAIGNEVIATEEKKDKNAMVVMMMTSFCTFIFAFFGSPICALVDSAVLKILGDQKLLYGNQRLWGSVSNGLHIFTVGLFVSKFGISNISFAIFFVGLVSFVIISLFVKFDDYQMMMITRRRSQSDITSIINNTQQQQQQQQLLGDNDSSGSSSGSRKDTEERRPLLFAGGNKNYIYDPTATATTINRLPPFLASSSHRKSSKSSSLFITTTRHASNSSIATAYNTLYLSNTIRIEDDALFRAFLTSTPTTSLMVLDAQMEANNKLLQQQQQQYHQQEEIRRRRRTAWRGGSTIPLLYYTPPPIGLVLSYIPTIDTSLSIFSAFIFSSSSGVDNSNEQQQQQQQNLKIIFPDKSILKSLLVYTFMISILLYGIAHSMISQFLFLLLSKNLGMDPLIIGLIGPIGGLAEVMTFWFSQQLLDKYSVTFLMTLAYTSFMFRALIFTCLNSHHEKTKSIIVALMLQIINGFAYALIWSTSVAEVDSFFPIEQRSMAQGILAALFSGLGYGIGCMLGGYILGLYGHIKLLQVSTVICCISLIVFLSGRRAVAVAVA